MKESYIPPAQPPQTETSFPFTIARGGRFKNDYAMPMYSNREFNAGFVYLNLLMDITDARKHHESSVMVDDKPLPLPVAKKLCEDLKTEFHKAIADEIGAKGRMGHIEVNRRAKNILASLMNTSYVDPDIGRF